MLVGITGGTGFIGSAVVQRHLLRGDAVRCLLRRRPPIRDGQMEFVPGDLTTPDALTRFADGLDVLYHCAGGVSDERRMPAVNLQVALEAGR